uniref:Uncharacterized protein n=1 Tax=Oryza rufipogon TaxID=4529 RepID=A0A0E0N8W7_ORYRU
MDTSDSGGSAAISRAIPMRTSGSIGQSCLVRQWQRERSLPHRVWRLWWLLAHWPVKECRDGIKLIFAPLYSLFLIIVLILRSRRILIVSEALKLPSSPPDCKHVYKRGSSLSFEQHNGNCSERI